MTLAEKVRSVEEVFQALDLEITAFKQWSGLQCSYGCGKCCLKPDIHATVLEFLPLAYRLYKEQKAYALYEQLSTSAEGPCVHYDNERAGGKCGAYEVRGLICRLFGYSARINKYQQADIMTCSVIKTEQAAPFQQAVVLIGLGERSVPVASRYYMQLMGIDDELSRTSYPINTAIRKALETVMHYYAYDENRE